MDANDPCPRCGHADPAGPACPRCGVIFSKLKVRLPARPAPEPSGRTSKGMLIVAGLLLAAAIGFPVVKRRSAPTPAPPVGAAPTSVTSAGDLPPLPLPSYGPPPPLPAAPGQPAAVTEADWQRARSLQARLASGASMEPADLQSAEALVGRHPSETALRDLLEAALLAVAGQERTRRSFAQAAVHLRRAAEVQPQSVRPWMGLLQVMLEAGDWSAAEMAARSAMGLEPRNFDAWRSLGYVLMRQDRSREAAEALRTALDIRDDSETRALLARVAKGLSDESGMTQQQLSHFHVRYDGEEHEDVGREILRALERHYATLASSLDYQPATTIPVILFSRQGYYSASGAPAWSGGAYDLLDGRIRIPIGGLTAGLTPDIDRTLIHELTHAFVADRTRGLAPRDLHEGLAQYMEGRRIASELNADHLRALADGRMGGVAGMYFGALSFVEYLVGARGLGGVNELLRVMGESGSVDEGFRQVHGQTHEAARQAWAEHLRRLHGS